MFATDVAFSSMTELSVGLLILRVAFGLTMAAHGYGKFFQGGRIPGTAGWFDSLGMKPNGMIHAVLASAPPRIDWSAAEGCPSPVEIERRTERFLGAPLSDYAR